MLLRVLLVAILIFLVVRFLMRLGRLAAAALREGDTPPARPAPPAVALVPCRRCGVFVPRDVAVTTPAGGFLCRACASAGS